MKIRHLLTVALGIFLIISCSKEKSFEVGNNPGNGGGNGGGSNTNGSIIGTWKLLYTHAVTSSTVEVSLLGDVLKTVTKSDYITKDNVGTITIDASKLTATGMAYTVDTTMKVWVYENGSLQDSMELPFLFTLPPTNSSANYTKVGSDSLYFPQGGTTSIGGGGNVQAAPQGYKYRFEGTDKLVLIAKVNTVTTQSQAGATQKQTNVATAETWLQKQ